MFFAFTFERLSFLKTWVLELELWPSGNIMLCLLKQKKKRCLGYDLHKKYPTHHKLIESQTLKGKQVFFPLFSTLSSFIFRAVPEADGGSCYACAWLYVCWWLVSFSSVLFEVECKKAKTILLRRDCPPPGQTQAPLAPESCLLFALLRHAS